MNTIYYDMKNLKLFGVIIDIKLMTSYLANQFIKKFLLSRSPMCNISKTYIESLPIELYLELIKICMYETENKIILHPNAHWNKTLTILFRTDDKLTFSRQDINATDEMKRNFIESIINKGYKYIIITDNMFAECIDNNFMVNYYYTDEMTGIMAHNMSQMPISYELFYALLIMFEL